jgi:hypothetical protein
MEIDGELTDALAWIAGLHLQEMSIEPCGVRAVYEQYHQSEESL